MPHLGLRSSLRTKHAVVVVVVGIFSLRQKKKKTHRHNFSTKRERERARKREKDRKTGIDEKQTRTYSQVMNVSWFVCVMLGKSRDVFIHIFT
jgi:hypothetical protein